MNIMKQLDRFLASNLFLRCISLLIAIGLWLYVNGDMGKDTEKELECPLQYLNLSSELTLDAVDHIIKIEVKGPRDVLSNLVPEDILCDVDLRGLNSGKYKLPVRVVLPGSLKLKNIVPANIEVSLVRYAEKVLPVHVNLKEELPSGMYIDGIELDPKEVTVKGPEEGFSLIKEAVISPSIDELERGGLLTLPVKLIQSNGADLNFNIVPSNVNFSAVLRRGHPKKTLPVEVPLVGKVYGDYTVSAVLINPSSIEVEGTGNELKKLSKLTTEPVDLTGLKKAKSMVLPIKLDNSLKSVHFPDKNSVNVKIILSEKTSRKFFSQVKVSTRGRSIYPAWSLVPESVGVLIEGPLSVMKELDEETVPFRVYVDVTNIVSKELRVPVKIEETIDKLRVISVDPERITVKALLE